MLPLLRFTRDLFEQKDAVSHMDNASEAIDLIATVSYRHPLANRETRLQGAMVAYHFSRGKRRTIGFSVGPDGLTVRAPRWTLMAEVDSAVKSKGAWILKKLVETRERHDRQESARIIWSDGAVFPYLGQSVTIVLSPGHDFAGRGAQWVQSPLNKDVAQLNVSAPSAATMEQIRDTVQAWIMRQAKDHFADRLGHFAPLLGVQWKKLSISSAGTRWGSARVDGSIRLNWRLMHFRPAVIDYVVAHELSHLRVMDHSPRFWDTVRAVVPDYSELRTQLKDEAIPKW